MTKWRKEATEFVQKLADLLGYQVWLAMDNNGKWFVYLVPVEAHEGTLKNVWAYIETDDVDFIPAPSFGKPRNWKNTLVHAVPRKDKS